MKMSGNVRSSLLKLLWHRIEEDDISGLSAQLAYFFLLALFAANENKGEEHSIQPYQKYRSQKLNN